MICCCTTDAGTVYVGNERSPQSTNTSHTGEMNIFFIHFIQLTAAFCASERIVHCSTPECSLPLKVKAAAIRVLICG